MAVALLRNVKTRRDEKPSSAMYSGQPLLTGTVQTIPLRVAKGENYLLSVLCQSLEKQTLRRLHDMEPPTRIADLLADASVSQGKLPPIHSVCDLNELSLANSEHAPIDSGKRGMDSRA